MVVAEADSAFDIDIRMGAGRLPFALPALHVLRDFAADPNALGHLDLLPAYAHVQLRGVRCKVLLCIHDRWREGETGELLPFLEHAAVVLTQKGTQTLMMPGTSADSHASPYRESCESGRETGDLLLGPFPRLETDASPEKPFIGSQAEAQTTHRSH
jgi:hypothetical protein